ncbi:DUF3000 family protein [Micrococcales bacterium 31B]|nr:DUF3000 family protein [Micrococcales bacterium 31B]
MSTKSPFMLVPSAGEPLPRVPSVAVPAPAAMAHGRAASDAEFAALVHSLRDVPLRAEVEVDELPAPTKLAPHAWAVGASVIDSDDEELGSGRFVLLHDPAGQDAWGGEYRVVTYVRTHGETYMTGEELAEVGWSWVSDGLSQLKTRAVLPNCTITEVRSTRFTDVDPSDCSVEIEMRASWSPANGRHLDEHLQCWSRIMCTFAGLPPESQSILTLRRT